jgi:hypothetical protein
MGIDLAVCGGGGFGNDSKRRSDANGMLDLRE